MLSDIVRDNKPDFIFFIETLCDDVKLLSINNNLDYDVCFSIPQSDTCMGLAFLAKKNAMAKLHRIHEHYIDVDIEIEGEMSYRLIGFYELVEQLQRVRLWELLRGLRSQLQDPWLVVGDFNDVLA